MRLTLVSLQGIVNGDRVRLYLDFENDLSDADSIFSFSSERYEIAHEVLDIPEVLSRYLSEAKGLFVYDPRKPESVNIGTMYAALNGLAIAGPDTVRMLSSIGQLPIQLDYSASTWSEVGAIEAYERALRDLHPPTEWRILAILPPENLAIRDYLIASKAFVFYHTQGPLASPLEHAATLRLLHAAPRGIPVMGWFELLTETEENLFLQRVSEEGKYFVGGQDTPNLSVLSALGRNQTFRQRRTEPASVALEDKVYTVLGVADGDSLDYITDRMRELWDSPVRGSLPIAWSLNPLLIDIAPPHLEYYYETATNLDSFVASPSGAGYLYPDYLGEGDLEPFLDMSSRYLQAADMDIVWLLNSFPASETHFSSESLSAYVGGLEPRGLVLDYDDEPVTRNTWMQAGGDSASPVVRSTHLWTTKENFLAKVQAAMDSWEPGPRFMWMTLYPWRFDLEDAIEVIEILKERSRGRLEVVSPEDFFALLLADYQGEARDKLNQTVADPVASIVFRGQLDSAQDRIRRSEIAAERGWQTEAAYEAYVALESLRSVTLWRAILIIGAITSVLVGIAAAVRRGGNPAIASQLSGISSLPLILATMALFLIALRSALNANFWAYHFVFLGIALAGFSSPLRNLLEVNLPRLSPIVFAVAFLVSVGLTIYTAAAFPLLMFTAVLLMESILSRRILGASPLLLSTLVGAAVGFLSPISFLVLGFLTPLILLPIPFALTRKPEERPTLPRSAWTAGFAASLPLVALSTSHYYSLGLRLRLEGDALGILGAGLLIASPIAAFSVARILGGEERKGFVAGALLFAATAAALVSFSGGTLLTSLLFLGMVTGMALFAYYYLKRFVSDGGNMVSVFRPMLAIVTLLLLFMRLPPIAYSLLITPLPEVMEYALYAPHLIYAAIVIVLLFAVAIPRRSAHRRARGERSI